MHDNRKSAGRKLSELLCVPEGDDPIVIAIARGGIPVGCAVAEALQLPLEVVAVSRLKVGGGAIAPIGAVAEDGSQTLNVLDGDRPYVRQIVRATRCHCDALVASFRKGRELTSVRGRTVLLVDDTMTTGATACAATRLLRRAGAARIVVAVPFALTPAAERVKREADAVVALEVATPLSQMSCRYPRFEEVSDDQILADLAAAPTPGPTIRSGLRDTGAAHPAGPVGQPSKSSNARSKHFDARRWQRVAT